MDIMTALFDEEEVIKRYINNTVKEEVNAARKENVEVIAKKMLAGGKVSYEEIAEYTGLSIKEVEELAALQTV